MEVVGKTDLMQEDAVDEGSGALVAHKFLRNVGSVRPSPVTKAIPDLKN